MRRRRPEQELQRYAWQRIIKTGVPGLVAFHPANGGWRTPFEAKVFKEMGLVAGACDLIFCIPGEGRFAGLELKAGHSKLTDAQMYFIDRVNGAGGIATWANEDNIDERLKYLGVIR